MTKQSERAFAVLVDEGTGKQQNCRGPGQRMTELRRDPTPPIDTMKFITKRLPIHTTSTTSLRGEQRQGNEQPIIVLFQKQEQQRRREAARLGDLASAALYGEQIAIQDKQRQSSAKTFEHDVGGIRAMGRAGG